MAKLSSLLGGIETGTPLVPGILAQTGVYPTPPALTSDGKGINLFRVMPPKNFWTKYGKTSSRGRGRRSKGGKIFATIQGSVAFEASEVVPTRNEAGPV